MTLWFIWKILKFIKPFLLFSPDLPKILVNWFLNALPTIKLPILLVSVVLVILFFRSIAPRYSQQDLIHVMWIDIYPLLITILAAYLLV